MPPTTRRAAAVPGAKPPMMTPPPPPATPPPTAQPDPVPQQQAAPPATVPAQQHPGTVAHQPAPQHANMFANTGPAAATATGQGGGGMSIPLANMVGPNVIDPENDRKPEAYRLPHYILDAVDAAHRMRVFLDDDGKPLTKQNIARRAFLAILPPQLLDQAYLNRYGRERPTD